MNTHSNPNAEPSEAVRWAVSQYHFSRPGNNNDRLPQEIEHDGRAWVRGNHPKWTEQDYQEVQYLVNKYNIEHPPPPIEPPASPG